MPKANRQMVKEMRDHEQYMTLAVSTGNIPQSDWSNARHLDSNMVMHRDTGFFVKLYDERDYNTDEFQSMSPEFNEIIASAHEAGFRMVEFDCDAEMIYV